MPCAVAVAAFTILFRLALAHVLPHPQASSPDELSYLLGAAIFASGHAAMPAHPYWQFFEMIHVLSHPVYAPKYPPAPSAALALGTVLFGDPFYGALLSVALFAAAVCWMLQAYVRPAWALLGGIATALYYGAGHYWTESYWGGAVPALGAALLIGAFARMPGIRSGVMMRGIRSGMMMPGIRSGVMMRGVRSGMMMRGVRSGIVFGAGVLLLLCSRPYEGGVLILFVSALIALSIRRIEKRAVVAAALAGIAAIAAMAAYNRAITGNPLTLPYRLHMDQYSENEPFWFAAPLPKKVYANHAVAAAYELYDYAVYKEIHDLPIAERFSRNLLTIVTTIAYDGGLFGLLPLLFVPLLRRDPLIRLLAICAALLTFSLLVEVLPFFHYMAPLLVVEAALGIMAIDRLWRLRRIKARDRRLIVAILIAGVMFGPTARAVHAIRGEKSPLYRGTDFGRQRARVAQDILTHPGDHVVFVRWSPAKPLMPPWVSNGPRIDAARLVWAHDRGAENRRLIEYFKGRHFWLLEDDDRGVRVAPYPDLPHPDLK